MALLDKLKQELDRAGKVAQDAFDDGKTRLEAFRTRQLADKAAQALGYAVYRAKKGGGDLDAATFDRLRATLETHDTEAARLEAEIELRRQQTGGSQTTSEASAPPA
ncbi:MAG: hypothetical protein M3365_07910 [Gemmatimonadota bacterium]|nr:hypothetical protein [Gemmatimonadota bacterium]